MKKHFTYVAIIICMVLATSFLAACSCGGGQLAYEGAALENGKVGVAYSKSVEMETDDTEPVTYELKSGSTLPNGLELVNGKVEGLPMKKTESPHKFTVVAKQGNQTGEAEFSITVLAGDLVFNGKVLPSGQINKEYKDYNVTGNPAVSIAASGASSITYAFKAENSLPLGLSLNTSTGAITGTPTTEVSDHKFILIASAGADYNSAEAEFSITVISDTIVYGNRTLGDIKVGETYGGSALSVGTAQTGGASVTYALKVAGSLPAGLSFNTSTGAITGTPRTAGDYSFAVVATAVGFDEPAEATFQIKVLKGDLKLPADQRFIDLYVGRTYERQISVTNTTLHSSVTVTYTIVAGELPEGIVMNSSGLISGNATTATNEPQSFTVRATAEPNYNSAEAEFEFSRVRVVEVVTEEGTIESFAARTLKTAYVGYTYSYSIIERTLTATNGAQIKYTVKNVADLPAGFSLTTGGLLSVSGLVTTETPLEAAVDYPFTVVASADLCDPVEVDFTLTLSPPLLECPEEFEIEQTAVVGAAYSTSIAVAEAPEGVEAPIVYTQTDSANYPMIKGLTLSESGILSGTPAAAIKTWTFYVEVSCEGVSPVTMAVTIRVRDAVTVVSDGIFQAELTDLQGLQGTGDSGSPKDENLIQPDSQMSETDSGYFVGYTHNDTIVIPFTIYSTATVNNATLSLSLASERGDLTLNPSTFGVSVNGTAVQYAGFTVGGSFELKQITVSLSLTEGPNVIELKVLQLTGPDENGGPAFDYLKISNYGGATLSWSPHTYNLHIFGYDDADIFW